MLTGAIILLLAGTVWILQGLDVPFAPKSFMTGDGAWVAWGVAAIVAGLYLMGRSRRNR
jgi:hypothetical protein